MGKTIREALGALFALSLIGASLAACGGTDHEAYCQKQRDCIGGNDADFEACIALREHQEHLADVQGCSDEYAEAFDCTIERLTCKDVQDDACNEDSDCERRNDGAPGKCTMGRCAYKSLVLDAEDACKAEQAAYGRCNDVDADLN